MPQKVLVLVVDDDAVGVALLKSRLTKEGYDVATAKNGVDGLDHLHKCRPDCIILDIEMPEMNGYSFIVEMQKEAAFRTLPVIVLTAHDENKAIFANRGIIHYLVKPVNFYELLPKVKGLTEKGGFQSMIDR